MFHEVGLNGHARRTIACAFILAFAALPMQCAPLLTQPPPAAQTSVFKDCDVCPEMVVLPGGGLALGRYEVTVGEYRAFASATGGNRDGCNNRSHTWAERGFLGQTDRHPVVCVSWDDAQAYVSWLSGRTGVAYRLPSETEWDGAAAGSPPGCYYHRTGNLGTCPVGHSGGNGLGLSDMAGNAWEWTSDCWEGGCGRRVLKGGSWSSRRGFSWSSGSDLPSPSLGRRPGVRASRAPGRRSYGIGFRVLRPLD